MKEPTGIDLVLESVAKIVTIVEASLNLGAVQIDRGVPTQPLREALLDLRASYFAFLWEQREANDHV